MKCRHILPIWRVAIVFEVTVTYAIEMRMWLLLLLNVVGFCVGEATSDQSTHQVRVFDVGHGHQF